MTDLTTFPITRRWPPRNPEAIQLYSLATPNGVKVSIALEETGLPYDAHLVSFETNDQMTPEFRSLNPNHKIPAILDPNGPGGKPMPLFESGAILLYLAEKTGQLMPKDPAERWQAVQWLMFQMGGVGPMFGQVGYFHKYAGKDIEDPRPRERYYNESRRLLSVLEKRMEGREWIVEGYSVADIAICPWLHNLKEHYKAGDQVGWNDLRHVPAWLDRFLARPAVQRGLNVPAHD